MLPLRFPRLKACRRFISAEQIQQRVRAMAPEITDDHPDGVHFVCVLKGAFMFLSDLARAMEGEVTLDFMARLELRQQHQVVRSGAGAEGPRQPASRDATWSSSRTSSTPA